MKQLPKTILASFLSVILFSQYVNARTWTEAKTGRSQNGEFIKIQDGKVIIKKDNLQILRIPIHTLSEKDQEFLKQYQTSEETEKEEETKKPRSFDFTFSAPSPKRITSDTAATNKKPSDWETDFAKASARAKSENKHMLLDFTGSDWCGWCIKLKNEVFDQKAFVDYAKDNLVLVELDFPSRKKQSDAEKKQNAKLAKKYGIRGYPTIIILDHNGKKVGQTGYKSGGPEAYIKHLQEFIGG